MIKLRSLPLRTLAIIGIVLYLGIAWIAPFLENTDGFEEEPGETPVVSKAEAAQSAAEFLRARYGTGPNVRAETLFQSHMQRSGYLQHAELYEEYKERYAERFPLDYWEVEVRDPLTDTSYYVAVHNQNRRILGWSTAKTDASKSLTVDSGEREAALLAEKTMREMDFDPGDFKQSETLSPDGELLWTGTKDNIGEAKLQLAVKISAGQVTSFKTTFTVPESFILWQERQDQRASQMTLISEGIALIMAIASLVIVIRYRKEIDFARGILLSLLYAAVYLINNFNMLPAFRTMHGAAPSEPEAIVYLWIMNIYVVMMAFTTYMAFLAGRKLWLSRGWDPWPSWQNPLFGSRLRTAVKQGYLLCLFILGVQQLMYFIASESFDVWAVNDPMSSLHNLTRPMLFPLLAWAAAISEEAVYRLLGIALALKLTGNRFVAVLLPSIIWAMVHTQYPVYPVYTRLIEVTLLGLIFGYAFLRYGLLTAIFAHAAMDSILMGLSLLEMGNPAAIAAGLVYLFMPALAGWTLAWLHGRITRRPPAAPPPDAGPLLPGPPDRLDPGRLTPL